MEGRLRDALFSLSKSIKKSQLPVTRTTLLHKAMQILVGVAILGFAHFVGYQLKALIYFHGRQDIKDIVGKDTVDTVQTQKDNVKQARQVKLVFVTLGQIVYYGAMLVGVLVVLKILGIETASIIALIGAVGFAIGLALQGSLSDIASGILLALLQVYAIGDIIQVDEVEGKVKDFNMFRTTLEDIHTKTVITIPNRKIQESVVINHTKAKTRTIVIDILASNKNQDFNNIIQIVQDQVNKAPLVLRDPEPSVGIYSMANVGTTVRAKATIAATDYPEAITPIRTAIREALAEKKVELVDPY
jgi:small conductance mechanosensitive channel